MQPLQPEPPKGQEARYKQVYSAVFGFKMEDFTLHISGNGGIIAITMNGKGIPNAQHSMRIDFSG